MCGQFLQLWLSSPTHWLFGLGTNAWVQISNSSDLRGNYVHNVAVEILCEHGIVGAAILVAVTVLTIRAGIRLWDQHRDDPALRSAAAIFLAISAFALFNALKQGSIVAITPFYWWLVMAKIARHEERLMPAGGIAPSAQPSSVDLEYGEQPGYALAR
jgi:O-antigen ligase